MSKKEYKTFDFELTLPYRLAYGPTWTRFFEGLQEEKIFGTKCHQCNRVLVPARSFCPQCFVDIEEWVQVASEGKMVTWAMINFEFYNQPKKPPYVAGMIQLDGADVSLFHLIDGFDMSNLDDVRKTLPVGRRVKAVWSDEKTGHILDIEYFQPI
jgi:uncharacterized OB-fold protein